MSWWTRAFGGDARAPRDVDAALRSALLAVLDRDYPAAERLLTAAVHLDSEAVEPYLALARLYRMRGEIGRAIRIHQNLLLRLDAGSKQGLLALADLANDFRQGGFLRRAIASYEEVLSHEPKHAGALRALMRLLADARDHTRAIEMTRRLSKLEGGDPAPGEAALRIQMAETAQAEGRSDAARRAAKQALRKDPSALRAWVILGDLEAERGRAKAALAAWKRVPELERGGGPLVYPQIEATYAALGRTRHYEVYLRKLLEEDSEDPGARLALARTLAARGEVDAGVAELRRILDRDPDDLEARITLGRFFLSEHRDGEATKEFAELLDVIERRGILRPMEKGG
jgi:lipopolysaccharide biosynthesis regulator YciM